MPERYILRCVAADRIGILAGVMGVLAAQELNVVESHDFGDPESGVFFIRAAFEAPTGFQHSDFDAAFESVAQDFCMSWTLRRAAEKPRVLVMVSKADHCLNDLLYRHRRDRLGADIVAIVSNHDDARWLAERHGVAFHHVPVTPETKPAAEQRLLSILEAADAELVVLARYMQILSPELTDALSGRCINIHHSFLPSFKGAKPYHQAHKRGVKLIGATAHYVTSDLDEGPIIAQDVAPVDHRMTPQDFVALGRDIEARVLVRAVTDHAEGRVFLNGARTVVFE
ncbi:MAG: formyltetrahydrofolate deformylase [Pseudomonadota bacterium]